MRTICADMEFFNPLFKRVEKIAKTDITLQRNIASCKLKQAFFNTSSLCSNDILVPARKVSSLKNLTMAFLHTKLAVKKHRCGTSLVADYRLVHNVIDCLSLPTCLKSELSNHNASCDLHNGVNDLVDIKKIPRYAIRPSSWLYAHLNSFKDWDKTLNDASLSLECLARALKQIKKGQFRKMKEESLITLLRDNCFVHFKIYV